MRTTRRRIAAVAGCFAAVLTATVVNPAQAHANPGVGGCVGVAGVSACGDVGVPNINAVANAIPNIPVPNINIPHINPGMFHGR